MVDERRPADSLYFPTLVQIILIHRKKEKRMLSQPKSKVWIVFTLLIVTNMILTACGGVAATPAPAVANTAMPVPPTYTPIPLEQATAAPTTAPEAVNTTAPGGEVNAWGV